MLPDRVPAVVAVLGAPPYLPTQLGPRTTAWQGSAAAAVHRRADSPRKALQEADALRRWGAAAHAPRLLHADREHLWTAWCRGDAAGTESSSEVWATVGAACAGLDRGPAPPDPLPLAAALAQRAAAMADSPWAALLARRPWSAWARCPRWPQHRDLAPRNILVDEQTIHVIDFEHARADAPGTDAVRLWLELHLLMPFAAADAAWLAWAQGRARAGGPSLPPTARLLDLAALQVVGTARWADRHGDPAFGARAARWRALLLDGAQPPTLALPANMAPQANA